MFTAGDSPSSLAVLAHELRTPLAAMMGAGENLEDLLADHPEEMVRGSLASLLRACEQANKLVNQVLEDDCLRAGRLRLEPQALRWDALCSECLALLRPQAQKKGQRLVLAGIGCSEVWADPLRIRQILLNLLENALKFSPPGGRVCLGVGPDPDGGVCAWVSDEGPGVPLAEAEFIFERFQRGEAACACPGTGLGLAIAKALAEAMGGRLWLTNPGAPGACFRLSLPAEAPHSL